MDANAPAAQATFAAPVESRRVERDGLTLYIDPVAQAAIDLARQAGISSPASFGGLPNLDDLPLLVVSLQCRVELLEARVDQIERRARLAGELLERSRYG